MEKARNWFFTGSPGSAGVRFLKGNKPTEGTFRDLLDSVPLFQEVRDTASASRQGLIKQSSDAHAYGRTVIVDTFSEAIMPWQLPNLAGSDDGGTTKTEAVHGGGNVAKGGLLIVPYAVTRTGKSALNFAISFDPSNLPIKVASATADYLIIHDTADDLPKRVAISGIGSGSYWQLIGGVTLSPSGSYALDMGTNQSTLANVLLDATADRSVSMKATTSATGKALHLVGSSVTGGVFKGGSLYLYGGIGSGGGTAGDIILAHNGSNPVGRIGLCGAPDLASVYHVKLTGNLWITGYLRVDQNAVGVGTGVGNIDADGGLVKLSYADTRKLVLPTGTDGKILVYNTDDWTAVAASGDITFDKDGVAAITAGCIVNADIHADAAIAISKLFSASKGYVMVSHESSGILEASTATKSDVALLTGMASAGVVSADMIGLKYFDSIFQLSADGVKIRANKFLMLDGGISPNVRRITVDNDDLTLNDSFIIAEIGAGASTYGIPDLTLRDRISYNILIVASGGGNLVIDAYGTQDIQYGGAAANTATIVAPPVNTLIQIVCDSVAGVWVIGHT